MKEENSGYQIQSINLLKDFEDGFQQQLSNHLDLIHNTLDQLINLESSQNKLLDMMENYINTVYHKPYLVKFFQDSWYDMTEGRIDVYITLRDRPSNPEQFITWIYLNEIRSPECFKYTINCIIKEADYYYHYYENELKPRMVK